MYRRPGRGRLLLLVFLALSILVITLDFRENPGGPLRRAKDLAVAVVAPVQRGFTTVTRPVGDLFSSIADLANLRSENRRLKERLDEVASQADDAEVLAEENERLLALLDLAKSYRTMDAEFARVIGDAPSNWNWAVQIDKGRAQGLRPDMAVINPDGLVGKVVQASENYALVLLLTDPSAAVSGRVEGDDVSGLVAGNGGGELLSMEQVDTTADVNIGDEINTQGLDRGVYPPGIEIGEVVAVGGPEAAIERSIDIQPSVDFDALGEVAVLLETGNRLRLARGPGQG